MSRAYEIRASTLHGLGVFAQRAFKPGEEILRERAAMEVQKRIKGENADPRDIYSAFESCYKQVQDEILQLTDCSDTEYMDHIRTVLSSYEEPERTHAIAVTSKFENNAIGNQDASWLCLGATRLNHSCLPNACVSEYILREDNRIVSIRAIKEIAEGDEILVSYCDLACSVAERQQFLTVWNINCACAACELATDEAKAKDKQREKLGVIGNRLDRRETLEGLEEALHLTDDAPELLLHREIL